MYFYFFFSKKLSSSKNSYLYENNFVSNSNKICSKYFYSGFKITNDT